MESAQCGKTPIRVPLIISVTFPDASRIAEPPAKITNAAYDMADINKASNVPFGIELPASLKSPEIFAPACNPVTKMDEKWHGTLFGLYNNSQHQNHDI